MEPTFLIEDANPCGCLVCFHSGATVFSLSIAGSGDNFQMNICNSFRGNCDIGLSNFILCNIIINITRYG